MISTQHSQEQLSRAFVHAVTSHAGFTFESTIVDYGVDGTIRSVRQINGRRFLTGHSLDVQLKATTRWSRRGGYISYDVEAKTYNDLVERFNEQRGTPMVLIVLCLPKRRTDWLTIDTDKLILKHSCYWCQVGSERTRNRRTRRIRIPQSNIVSKATVSSLMQKVAEGDSL